MTANPHLRVADLERLGAGRRRDGRRSAGEAGAILLGKLNMHGLPMVHGRNRIADAGEPVGARRMPGGSSSGSGRVATGLCAGALGAGTGARPDSASLCGIVGQADLRAGKPPASSAGLVAGSHRPHDRTVTDTALLLQALAGHDRRIIHGGQCRFDYRRASDRIPRPRVGVVRRCSSSGCIRSGPPWKRGAGLEASGSLGGNPPARIHHAGPATFASSRPSPSSYHEHTSRRARVRRRRPGASSRPVRAAAVPETRAAGSCAPKWTAS
jgi:hypothetical protein